MLRTPSGGRSEPLTGIVGAVDEGLENPFTHDDLPEIRDQGIIQPSGKPPDVPGVTQSSLAPVDVPGAINPSASPVDVPGARSSTGPSNLDYQGQRIGPGQQQSSTGPSQLGYQGQRVGTGPSFSAPGDVRGIQAGQQGQYGQQAGPGVGPSQTFRGHGPSQSFGVDPNSGRYQGAPSPTGFQGQGNSLEQATFQRGLNRIDPYLQEQREGISQRLQNQGLPVNSEAYDREMDRFDRGRGDALGEPGPFVGGSRSAGAGTLVQPRPVQQAIRIGRSGKAVQGKAASYGFQCTGGG